GIVEKGVHSYITRYCGKDEILLAVRNTLKGDRFFCNKVLSVILEKNSKNNGIQGNRPSRITSREKEILLQIAQGKIAKEISEELNISVHTIYTHRKNLMKKLGLKSPVELIMLAMDIYQKEFN
ncbi:MAG: response regulator transcription factor, partial [Melioribacteraceae bacterium]|nr:response regulator transcription factor [Melioribacteraceae bacterium]